MPMHVAPISSLLYALLIVLPATTYGGTTGKIAGNVTDDQGAPLPGVAVTILGSRLGASTDADGDYPVGVNQDRWRWSSLEESEE